MVKLARRERWGGGGGRREEEGWGRQGVGMVKDGAEGVERWAVPTFLTKASAESRPLKWRDWFTPAPPFSTSLLSLALPFFKL